MGNDIKKRIEEIFDETPADSYHKGQDWNGYEVYELEFDKKCFVGLPLVILVKGEEVRLSTPEESFAYLDYSSKIKNQNKDAKTLRKEQTEEL